MQRKINTGFAISIIVILAIVFGGVFWMMGEKNIADAPAVQSQATQTVPQATNVAEKQTEQKNSQSSIDVSGWKTYKNEKYGFEFKYPQTWFEQKPIDGLMAFNVYFTSKDIANDYNKLGKDDVQLSVVRVKNESQVGNDKVFADLEKNRKMFSTFEVGMTDDENNIDIMYGNSYECSRVYYSKRGNISYQIQMTASGINNCETVQKYSNVYEVILDSLIVK